jgi:trans-2,3-dihydro-3-hydroxyanthranilate isomerase
MVLSIDCMDLVEPHSIAHPMRLSYSHLDVFADTAFAGNQLAVFTDAEGLDARRMQRIAAEMAFSETTFVFPSVTREADARVRIFTPATELPMAGHPTIGTVFAMAEDGRIEAGASSVTLGLGVGPTPVLLEWDRRQLAFAWMRQPLPRFGLIPKHVEKLAAALGLDERDIRESGLPPQELSSGVPFLFVPLATRAAVNRASLDRATLRAFFDLNGQEELPVFVFSLERGDDNATVFSRMFAPLFGVPEDPATGGASGPLGAYLLQKGAVTPEQAKRMVSLQGVAMGRPSRITISVLTRNHEISDVRVGGTCVALGAGFLDVPDVTLT